MRRPVDVKAHFHSLPSVGLFLFGQAASVLPSALFVSDIRSVPGGFSCFSRCCYLPIIAGKPPKVCPIFAPPRADDSLAASAADLRHRRNDQILV